jgi:methyl-accepting chemotaxis protein
VNPLSSIRNRVLFGTLGLALIPLIVATSVLGYLAINRSRTALQERATAQLTSIRDTKASELVSYFDSQAQVLNLLAASKEVRESMQSMTQEFPLIAGSLKNTIADRRAAVTAYYANDFANEFKRRNAKESADMAAIVETLSDETVTAQYVYTASNPNPLGKKNLMTIAPDTSAYSATHAKLQPFFTTAFEQFGFYDFFLVDADSGNVVFTYFKELDYGTNLLDGPYAGTNLGDAFVSGRDASGSGEVSLTDFAPYLPSYDDQASFIATPIFDGDKKVGVLIAQMSVDRLNQVATFSGKWDKIGLGQTGEAYLLGEDGSLRSDSRFRIKDPTRFIASLPAGQVSPELAQVITAKQSAIGLLKANLTASKNVRSDLLEAGGSGNTQVGTFTDYRGQEVLAATTPIQLRGLSMTLVAKEDTSEAFASLNNLVRTLTTIALGLLGLLGLLGALVATGLGRSINKPIAKLQSTVAEVAGGNLDARTKLTNADELGNLGRAFDNLLDERVSTLAASAKENEQLNTSVIEIMQAVGQMAMNKDLSIRVPVTPDVTGAVSDAVNMLAKETTDALRQVFNYSASVAQASTRVKQRSDAVLAAAESSGQEVAAASDELSQAAQALSGIARDTQGANVNAERALLATQEAMRIVTATVSGISLSRDTIRETEKRIKRLGERSQEINSVVGIISNIAERTSILALNASMQAVAAGEAGRGFAVVADEVKRLAENARDATQQIANLVGGIQADTVDAVQSMNNAIGQVVDMSKLAEQAGTQMEQSRAETTQLASAVKAIANTTAEQARNSDTLIARANQISVSTKETLDQMGQQNQETSRLLQYAKGLLDTVRQFRLPPA